MTDEWIKTRAAKVKAAIDEQRAKEQERQQREEALGQLAPRAWDAFSESVTRFVEQFNEEFDEYDEARIDSFEKLPSSTLEARRTAKPPITVTASLHKDGHRIQYKVRKGQSELEGTLSFDLRDGKPIFSDSRSTKESGAADEVARSLIEPFFEFGEFKF